jgi:nitrous oxidase accessory protein
MGAPAAPAGAASTRRGASRPAAATWVCLSCRISINATPAGSVLKLAPGRLLRAGGGRQDADHRRSWAVTSMAVARERSLSLKPARPSAWPASDQFGSSSHDTDDACLNVRGDANLIEDLRIDNCLFGIDLKKSNDNVVRGNRIRSKPFDLGTRGDSLRLWYSHRNLIAGNSIEDSRDMVAWYSNDNRYVDNVRGAAAIRSTSCSPADNLVEGNRFYDNAVGVYVMYSGGGAIRNNLFSHANGPTGMAVGFKEASTCSSRATRSSTARSASVSTCRRSSPTARSPSAATASPTTAWASASWPTRKARWSRTTVPSRAILRRWPWAMPAARGTTSGAAITGTIIRASTAISDNVGDRPHEVYAYADRLWMELPYARFFRNAPMMEMLDFLERLAPFSAPVLLLRDGSQPVFRQVPASETMSDRKRRRTRSGGDRPGCRARQRQPAVAGAGAQAGQPSPLHPLGGDDRWRARPRDARLHSGRERQQATPAAARRARGARFSLVVHQVRSVRAGLPGSGDQARRHRQRLRPRGTLHRRATRRPATFPAMPCSASWPARQAH